MKKTALLGMLATALTLSAQVEKEPDLTYQNNYYTTDEFKSLSTKPAALKYETSGNTVTFTHTSKGADTYNIVDLFPRGDYEHTIRDFNLAFNFTFSESSGPDDFLQLTFLVIPHQDFEYNDSVALVVLRIKPNGTLYAEYGNMAYNDNICYGCPALARDKTWAKVMGAPAPANLLKPIPGFKTGGTNAFSLSRTEDHWVLRINDQVVTDWKNMEMGYINSRQQPMVTLNGKCAVKMEDLNETYGHQNASLIDYLKDMKGSGIAGISGSCIKGEAKAYYAITTHYGNPSVRLSWRDNDEVKTDEVAYFDFKEGENYGEYKYRGTSTKNMTLFNEPGYAQDITLNPENGEISFDFYFQNYGSFEKNDQSVTITSKYCTVYISR